MFDVFDWIFALLLLGAGLLMLLGKGNILMGGAKGGGKKKDAYDEQKMQKGFGVGFLLLAAGNIFTIYVKNFAASVGYMIYICIIILGMVVYVNKYCKKK